MDPGIPPSPEALTGGAQRRRHLVPAAAIAAVVLAGYANSFSAPFTFDDRVNIVEVPGVHMVELDAASLARAADGIPTGRWLARVSFALNYLVGGLDPWGYHAVNLLFHLGAALLVYALALEILARLPGGLAGPPVRPALVTALLFAVHPVQTQAVTYVVQRMTSMGACFGFAALWLFLRARVAEGRARRALAGGALVAWYLAFACKETFVVLPLLALVLEALLFPGLGERLRRNRERVAAGAAALALIAAALLRAYWPIIQAEHARFGIPLGERLLSQGRILAHYVSLLVLPLPGRLQIDYDWPPSRGLLDPPSTLPALLALGAAVVLAVAARRRAPLAALAVLWFVAALSLEQSILPIDLVFEHRLYLASVGPFLLVAASLERLAAWRPALRWSVAAPLVAVLAVGTHVRNEAWADPLRLYASATRTVRTEARTLLTLGDELRRAGRLAEAEATLRQALAIEPGSVQARVNLGTVAWAAADLAAAERWYREAVTLAPGSADGWYNLGCLLSARGRGAEARAALEQALAADPRYVRAHLNLATLAFQRGDAGEARSLLDTAIRIDPGYALAYQNRALVSLGEGRIAEALEDARAAVRHAPSSAEPHAVLGEALRAAGHAGEAAAAYDRALSLDARSARAAAGLAALGR